MTATPQDVTAALTITLPLPHEILHPNGRTRNHNYRARLVATARSEAAFVANHAAGKLFKPFAAATIHATFYMPRSRDDDGLVSWLKPYIDGIVADAGLVSNDSRVKVSVEQITGKRAGGERKVVLKITERTGAQA